MFVVESRRFDTPPSSPRHRITAPTYNGYEHGGGIVGRMMVVALMISFVVGTPPSAGPQEIDVVIPKRRSLIPPRPRTEPPSPPASFFESLEDNVVLYTILTKPIGRYCEALMSTIWSGFTPHIICWGCPDMPTLDSTAQRVGHALAYFRHAAGARWVGAKGSAAEIVVFHYDATDVFFLSSRRAILRAASRTSWPYVKFDVSSTDGRKSVDRSHFEAQWAFEPNGTTITDGSKAGLWRFPPGVMLISAEQHCFAQFHHGCDERRMRVNGAGKKMFLNSGLWVAGASTAVKYLEQVWKVTFRMPNGAKCDQCVMIFLMGNGYAADGRVASASLSAQGAIDMKETIEITTIGPTSTRKQRYVVTLEANTFQPMPVMLLDSNNSVFQSGYQRDMNTIVFDSASGRLVNTLYGGGGGGSGGSRVKILHLNGQSKVVHPIMEPYFPWYYFSRAAAPTVANVSMSMLEGKREEDAASMGKPPLRIPAAAATRRGRSISDLDAMLSPVGRRHRHAYMNRLRKTARFWDSLAAARVYVDGVSAAFEDICPGFVRRNRPEAKMSSSDSSSTSSSRIVNKRGVVKKMRVASFPPAADIDDAVEENFNDFGNLFEALRAAAAVTSAGRGVASRPLNVPVDARLPLPSNPERQVVMVQNDRETGIFGGVWWSVVGLTFATLGALSLVAYMCYVGGGRVTAAFV